MKFKKSTALLFASALVLGTGVFIYEVTLAPQLEAAKQERQKVFKFEMSQVKFLKVQTPERTLEFVPVETKQESTERKWEMTVQESATKSELNGRKPIPANEAYVSFLLSLLMNAQSDREIPVSDATQVEYGLDRPQATIDFTLKDDTRYQLVLGKRDFSDNFLYAIANYSEAPNTKGSAILLPVNFENGVNRSLSEWKADSETADTKKPSEANVKAQETPKPEEGNQGEKPPTPATDVDSNLEEKNTTTPEVSPATSEPSTLEVPQETTPPENVETQTSTPPAEPTGENSQPSTLEVPQETTEPENVETPSATPPAEPKTPEKPLDDKSAIPAEQPYPEPKPYVRSKNKEE